MSDQHRSRVWAERSTEPITLTGGRWRCELRGDEIAEICYDGTRVARAVRTVARDRDWNTCPVTVVSSAATASGYLLGLRMHGPEIDIDSELTVIMDGTGCRIDFAATPTTDIDVNRLGLVVLHPPELAGTPLTVTEPSGEVQDADFPVALAPWQPARDIARLAWCHDGVRTTTAFAGDVFEMEDQRNWTDASFKTYSRPLELPFPYRVGAGERIIQSVQFDAIRERPRPVRPEPDLIELADATGAVPEVSLGASGVPDAGAGPIPGGVASVLVELDTRDDGWPTVLAHAAAEAGRLPLDLRLIADAPDRLAEPVRRAGATAEIVRVGVFSVDTHVSEPDLWKVLRQVTAEHLPTAELVGGSRAHYTELNRTHHRLPGPMPSLTFALTPQMHASETEQLVESIEMQAVLLGDAARIAGGRSIHVGPITLRPRFNDVATSATSVTEPADVDPRQSAPGLEPWTVASFAAVCGACDTVASVCYFEIAGRRGLGTGDRPFPVARAVAAIAGLRGRGLVRPVSATPPGWWLVGGVAADGTLRLLAASLADDHHSATIRYAGRDHRLTLAPYQVAELTLG